MITLGVNAAFHDSAAALVIDGRVVAAAEEERFTRIKHGKRPLPFSAWELPYHAIDFCLAEAGIVLADVDHVAYSYDPREFLGTRAALDGTIALPMQPAAQDRGDWESPWDPLFAAYIVNAPRQLADGAPHHLRRRLAGVRADAAPYRWHFVQHHLCHQASAFLAAPFERCAVMTLDGRGEHATTTYGVYRDASYQGLGEVRMPHSLGMLYERVTTHLGFLHSSDEYKVMALAALGQPVHRAALAQAVRVGRDGQYTVDAIDLDALAGAARVRGAAMEQRHLDLAASLQEVLEDTVLALAAWLREASGERQLAMAGGVALNCVMNGRLRDDGPFDAVWVQPAAGDAGTALGAALWIDARERRGDAPTADHRLAHAPTPADAPASHHALGPATRHDPTVTARHGTAGGRTEAAALALGPRRWTMEHAYLGPSFGDAAIEQALAWAKLPYRRLEGEAAIAEAGAALLARGAILGWFQGAMEWGPRSLGARSILASPVDPGMQARLNELKDREDFRPVAPAVLHGRLADWFTPAEANGGASPFMLFVYRVRAGQGEHIPSACHVDGTARVQTVHRTTNPRLHALIEAFERATGVPVVVNTSFNVRGAPIVCTPKDAIEAFWSTPLDALLIGSFLLEKPPCP